MSIFKGDSIYKTGGGGGGYKDGGQLVDGDFIKVENNTVSSYDNVSRDPVNFYFEVKDGEVLNGIIEFTTEVNATVNVYVMIDDVYYLLGNVGGDTVTAGNDYKINITGDSYSIEQVSGGLEPKYISLMGTTYGITKIGNLYWTTKNLELDLSPYGADGNRFVKRNGTYWYATCENVGDINLCNLINSIIENSGFRIPFYEDTQNLQSSTTDSYDIRSLSGWQDDLNGNGATSFNAYPYGELGFSGPYPPGYYNVVNQNKNATFAINAYPQQSGHSNQWGSFYIRYNQNGISRSLKQYVTNWQNIRLCKDV